MQMDGLRSNDRSVSALSVGACYLAFFLSGSASLIYELSWSRQIGLLLGQTSHAASTVLGCFFLGMAVGYGAGGAVARRVAPLMAYAAAEIAVVCWTFVIPQLLSLAETPVVQGWLSHPSPLLQLTLRSIFCGLLLLPATAALGATLPLMAEFLSPENSAGENRRITAAYAWNTAGAFFGLTAATFFLLVEYGVRGSSYLAAAISCLAALIALGVSIHTKSNRDITGAARTGSGGSARPGIPKSTPPTTRKMRLIDVLAASSGFGILALEVLYLRLFSLVFHNSTYTFGIVVAAFLAALAIGAAVATWGIRHFRAEHVVAWAALLASGTVVASASAFVITTGLEYFSLGETFVTYLGGAALLVAGIVLPPVAALGVLFPVLWMIPREASDGGPTTGRLAMFNTLGAAAGSVAASYLLLPFLGLWGSFVAISALFGLMAFVTFCSIASPRLALLTSASVTALSVLSWCLLSGWSQPESLRQETIVQRWETVYGWIDLVHDEHTDEWKIRQNLHYRLGATGPRSVRERRQALVPLLIHQRPKNVLFLGQGTGVTAAGALAHDQVEQVTIVELIPEVVEAARLLSQFNDAVIDDVRVRVEIDDARHFLRQASQLYDVIVSDLFVPWESHTGYLYTVEHFKAGRARLAPGGLYCQWLPLYQLGGEDFEMIADSFASVFPSTTLWWGQLDADRAMIALVGSERTPQINLTLVEKQTRLIGGRARDPLLASPEQLHDLSAGSWKAAFGAHLNTDEHPRIEFGTPLSQGDRRLLTGPTLETYYDRVLDRLDEPDLGNGVSQSRQLAARRGWQRFLLFAK